MRATRKRWEKAQKAEAAAWVTSPTPKPLRGVVRQEALSQLCLYTLLNEDELKRLKILEIGGATVERAFDEVGIPPKISIDPLFPFGRLVGQNDSSCHRVRAMGEYLPLPDNIMDLCWCANTIDHVYRPAAVLDEIWRVLQSRGRLVISCHAFPAWLKPLYPLLNAVDAPHPHHFTRTGLRDLLGQRFEIQKEFTADFGLRFPLLKHRKVNAAVILGIEYVFFHCVPLKKE